MVKDSEVAEGLATVDEILGTPDEVAAEATGATFVCDAVDGNGVCGLSFATNRELGTHRWAKHRIRGTSSTATAKAKQQKGRSRKPPAAKAATVATGPTTSRSATYTASLSMAALACYFAVPPFDKTDLDICNAGVPNIGTALAGLADHNPSVARTCDLILGGGGGGDWIAVIMAVVPVVGAIAANHGVVPATSGARFGEMIGFAPVVPAPSANGASPPPESPEQYPQDQTRTPEDVIAFFAGTPETVMTDAMTKMMSMGGPIPVAVPDTMTVTENPDGHRGSEQLRPVEPEPYGSDRANLNDAGAEQEPESALSP